MVESNFSNIAAQVEQATPECDFDLEAEYARIQEDPVVNSVKKFLDVATPLQVRVTTSQQLANMNDHKNIALVFDMRSSTAFNEC